MCKNNNNSLIASRNTSPSPVPSPIAIAATTTRPHCFCGQTVVTSPSQGARFGLACFALTLFSMTDMPAEDSNTRA